jgi:hypothetical protein
MSRSPPRLPFRNLSNKKTKPIQFGSNAKMNPETVYNPLRTIKWIRNESDQPLINYVQFA